MKIKKLSLNFIINCKKLYRYVVNRILKFYFNFSIYNYWKIIFDLKYNFV